MRKDTICRSGLRRDERHGATDDFELGVHLGDRVSAEGTLHRRGVLRPGRAHRIRQRHERRVVDEQRGRREGHPIADERGVAGRVLDGAASGGGVAKQKADQSGRDDRVRSRSAVDRRREARSNGRRPTTRAREC